MARDDGEQRERGRVVGRTEYWLGTSPDGSISGLPCRRPFPRLSSSETEFPVWPKLAPVGIPTFLKVAENVMAPGPEWTRRVTRSGSRQNSRVIRTTTNGRMLRSAWPLFYRTSLSSAFPWRRLSHG